MKGLCSHHTGLDYVTWPILSMGGEGLGNQQRHKWGVRWAWEPLGWTRGGSLPHGDQEGRTQKQASDVSVVESAVFNFSCCLKA